MATMKAKRSMVEKLYLQFKMYGLTTEISYTEYLNTVGSGEAISLRAIAKGWRGRWPVVMSQLKSYYPDVDEVVNKIEEPEPVSEPKKLTGLDALVALSANKEDQYGEDF